MILALALAPIALLALGLDHEWARLGALANGGRP